MNEANNLIRSINPDHYESFIRWKMVTTCCAITFLLALIGISCYHLTTIMTLKKNIQENAHLTHRHQELQETVASLQHKAAQLEAQFSAIKPLQTAGSSFLAHFDQMSAAMDLDVRITSYLADTQSITLHGESGTLQGVMTFNRALTNLPFFENIQLQSIKPHVDGSHTLYHFHMHGARAAHS